MIKVFRHKGVTKKVLWVVAALIIVSFVFGGLSMRYGSAFSVTQAAGKVYGKRVSLKEFQQNYQDVHDQAVMTHGANAEKIIPLMNLEDETWTRIILLKAAQERNIKASDMEVIQYIGSIPFFQRDGQFDKKLYSNIVSNVFRRDARDFEEGLRDQIKIMKLFAPELKKINLTDEAIRKEYERRNQKVDVSYITVSPETLKSGINPDENELKSYFESQRESFKEPEAVNAAIITIPFGAKATDQEKKEAAGKADELFAKLKNGADLASSAKSVNATVKETGFFNISNPASELTWSFELLQKIFAAKPNDIIAPSEGTKGYNIVKVLAQKPAFIPEFNAVKDKVKEACVSSKAMALAVTKAEEIQKTIAQKIKSGATFTSIAADMKMDVKSTGFFNMGSYIPEIGLSEDFSDTAFKLNKENPLSTVVKTSRGPAILYWNALEPVDMKKFETDKKDFEESFYSEERIRVLNEFLRSLREKAKLENFLEKIDSNQKKAMEKLRVR